MQHRPYSVTRGSRLLQPRLHGDRRASGGDHGSRLLAEDSVCPERQACSVGGRPTGARARRPVAWMAGRRETDALKPIDDAIGKDGREWPGRNVSERKGSPESAEPRRPSVCYLREGSRDCRSLADAAAPLRRGVSDGTVTRTRPASGEALLVPPRNRRIWVGRITGAPGKAADDERVADGPVRATRRGNARGAKGPCCSATPPTTRKAGAS
jgi:hypothetical protein